MAISEALIYQEKAAMQLAAQGDYLNASKVVLSNTYNDKVTEMANAKIGLTDGKHHLIMQINKGMERITVVVEQNSTSAEDFAAASEELAGQAHNLRGEVRQFRLHPDALGAVVSGGDVSPVRL